MALVRGEEMLSGSPLPGWHGRFFHTETMTCAHDDIEPGAPDLHRHHHLQEEVWNVVDGRIVLVVSDEEWTLFPGDAAVIPPGTPHGARVVGPCRVIVVDHPRRDQLPGLGGER